jgi:DNA-binding beta-propeller fold protein YncE
VISGRTSKVTATIPMRGGQAAIATDPTTNKIFVAGYNRVKVISGRTRKVTAIIRVGNGPSGIKADPRTNDIYVANSGSDTVSVLAGRRCRGA